MLKLSPLVLLLAALAYAQDFSGDMVTTSKQGKSHIAKVYVSNNKMRVEGDEENRRGAGAAVIDFSTNSAIIIMSEQRMYMDMPMQRIAQNSMAYWRPDPNDACPGWQKIAAASKDSKRHIASCHRLGVEQVNGRNAVKYEGTSTSGELTTVWIDPQLRFPLKVHNTDSDYELKNIQEVAQPASLFAPPAGYRKFEMPQGMQVPQHQ
jgi:outer membrane lipoprotein-sorting protein